jgi:hypothetical protein
VPAEIATAKIQPLELASVLEHNFRANKSTGLSLMPLQCLKWLGDSAVEVLADFLNVSAI